MRCAKRSELGELDPDTPPLTMQAGIGAGLAGRDSTMVLRHADQFCGCSFTCKLLSTCL